MDMEAIAWHTKRRFPNLPIILLSAYSEMPERILWLVDEYVMKSELPERRTDHRTSAQLRIAFERTMAGCQAAA
jgi:hypothetical protein